jgi:hypothetical protein
LKLSVIISDATGLLIFPIASVALLIRTKPKSRCSTIFKSLTHHLFLKTEEYFCVLTGRQLILTPGDEFLFLSFGAWAGLFVLPVLAQV